MNYGLIGEKLTHSYSKVIHEMISDYTYDIVQIPKDGLETFMNSKDFKGINVTIPYKQDVMKYLDEIDAHAENIGAVNTIVNHNGRLTGHNTDFAGFLYTINKYNVEITGKKVLVLGRGGASKAVIAVLKHLGAGSIYTVYHKQADDCLTYDEAFCNHADADAVINTTPVGMYPATDASPVDLSHFGQCKAVIDIIYNPIETKLTKQAKELGMTCATGLDMLVAQAVYASEFFTGKTFFDSEDKYSALIDDVVSKVAPMLSIKL